jgi:hypothetical protein
MRKLASLAAMAATLLFGSAADAASLVFDFDASNSSLSYQLTSGSCLGFPATPLACQASSALYDPLGTFEIAEGETKSFAFGKLSFGPPETFFGSVGGDVSANLMFLTSAGAAGFGATATHTSTFGVTSPGLYFMEWTPFTQDLTTADGSTFTVAFPLFGFEYGTGGAEVELTANITVTHVATPGGPQNPGGIPEPATWALMIGGFGMAGARLRHRGALAA